MPLRPSDCKPARSTGTQRRFSCFGDNERQPLDIEQTSSLKSAMKDGAENMSTVSQFPLAEGGVDPDRVPKRILYTGAAMPAIGFGTFGSRREGQRGRT